MIKERPILALCATTALMCALTGCGANNDNVAGRINGAIDSLGTDGNGNEYYNDGRYTDQNGYYGSGYNNTTTAPYTNNTNNGSTDTTGTNDANGTVNYTEDSTRYSTDTLGENITPYGYGMPGAENIIGNNK